MIVSISNWPGSVSGYERDCAECDRSRPRSLVCPSQSWLGGRSCGDLRFRFGRLVDRHTIHAFGSGLLRDQCQAELLAHHTREEAADRVLLPTRRLHDGGDRCPLGLFEQGEDGLLLGPATGRTGENGFMLHRGIDTLTNNGPAHVLV
jgi:hypothetical protein